MLHISFIVKPIMCTFYFLNPISEAQGSQGWSEKEGTFVCCVVLGVPLEAFRTMAFTHYYRNCGGGLGHRHPLQGEKTIELCILLIFVNAKCILSGDLRLHIIMHQKIRSYFFFSEGVSDSNSHILFLCCQSNSLEEKYCHVFCQGKHKL